MGKELEGIHHAQMAAPSGPDWALDFMQQSGPAQQQQHREFHNDAQFQEFENVFRNAQQQQGPQLGGMSRLYLKGGVLLPRVLSFGQIDPQPNAMCTLSFWNCVFVKCDVSTYPSPTLPPLSFLSSHFLVVESQFDRRLAGRVCGV